MCQAKPGRRCSGSAKKLLSSAESRLAATEAEGNLEQVSQARQEVEAARTRYNMTPAGMAELSKKISDAEASGDTVSKAESEQALAKAQKALEKQKKFEKDYKDSVSAYAEGRYSESSMQRIADSVKEQALEGATTKAEKKRNLKEAIKNQQGEVKRAEGVRSQSLSAPESRIYRGQDVYDSDAISAASSHLQLKQQKTVLSALETELKSLSRR